MMMRCRIPIHPSISVHAAAWPMVAWWVSRKQIGGRRRPAGTSRGGFIPRKRVPADCVCVPTGGRFRWYAATLQQYVFSVCICSEIRTTSIIRIGCGSELIANYVFCWTITMQAMYVPTLFCLFVCSTDIIP
jgi:hypothetical protein